MRTCVWYDRQFIIGNKYQRIYSNRPNKLTDLVDNLFIIFIYLFFYVIYNSTFNMRNRAQKDLLNITRPHNLYNNKYYLTPLTHVLYTGYVFIFFLLFYFFFLTIRNTYNTHLYFFFVNNYHSYRFTSELSLIIVKFHFFLLHSFKLSTIIN